MSDQFPYGNSLEDPDSWVGLGMTKSRTWLIGYHSGASLFVGGHTFLLFGKENLMACVVSFIGAGLTASWGISRVGRQVDRVSGRSNRLFSGEAVADRLERAKDINDAQEWASSGDDLNSAVDIYKALRTQTNGMTALRPFKVNDLSWKSGTIAGASVDVVIGGSTYYIAEANGLFANAHAFNIKSGQTLVSAGIGTMKGFWRVKKSYSLWAELAHSKRAEYPFMNYDVHPFFQRWRSEEYAYQKMIERVDAQDRLNSQVADWMQRDPAHFGFPDRLTAGQRAIEWRQQFLDGGRRASSNPFLPWIDMKHRHLFGN